MITRIWHGWASQSDADVYEQLLREVIFPRIAGKNVKGYQSIQLLRRSLDSGEEEFITLMQFDSWKAVKEFAGDDYKRAYVPEEAQKLLIRYDNQSQHYEVKESIEY